MSLTKGLDGIYPVDPAVARKHGRYFLLRYLDNGINTASCLKATEVRTYSAAGFGIGSIWEAAPGAAAGGEPSGIEDAKFAVAAAKALPQPEETALYLAVDVDPAGLPGGLPTAVAYFRGVASVLRPAKFLVGAYLGAAAANEALAAGVIDRVMIPAASSWGDGATPKRVDILQGYPAVRIGGRDYDPDTAAHTAGLWNFHGPWPEVRKAPAEREVTAKVALVSKGDQSETVRNLQGALHAAGYFGGTDFNGHYGPETDVAVRAFQRAHSIGEADHFGPECYGALFGVR